MTNRHYKILEELTKNQKMEVSALAEMLEVSQVTIRKDLDLLEDQGLLYRMHGYACIDRSDDESKCLAFNYDLKKRIARLAAETVKDRETVMLESGALCALLAEELVNSKKDITIVTNSVFIANHIRHISNGKIILLGGYFLKDAQVNVGLMTSKCGENFFPDKLFIQVDGFSENHGFTGRDHLRVETVVNLSGQVKNVIVLTESEKFNRPGMVSLMRTEEVNSVYTDDGIPQGVESFLRQRDVRIKKVPRCAA
ncbi:MAG: DeoR/GlpR family DNA-binding transcription regulator [Treponema sp.]|jgi:DeoR/GlpR family transcriptional regulator of sugar metabolism|nr:DeoR/GlpR family DNA-binding transcription regulator [Treponema sp.]